MRTVSLAVIATIVCSLVPGVVLSDPPAPASSNLPAIEYLFEGLRIRGNHKTSGFLFRQIIDLRSGQRVQLEALDQFRRELLATGFFSSVETRLSEGTRPEHVVVEVDVVERNTILVSDIYFGTSAQTPVWGGLELAETNLFGSGLHLAGGFVVSGDQGAVQVTVADPLAAMGFSTVWSLQGFYQNGVGRGPSRDGQPESEEAWEYQRFGGRLGVGPRWRLPISTRLTYRVEGLDFVFIDRISPHPATGVIPGTSLFSTIGLDLGFSSLDHPTLPRSGYRAGLHVEGGGRFLGSDYSIVQLVGRFSGAVPIGRAHVIRFQAIAGALWDFDSAPYFEGFYTGDFSPLVPSRNLGLQFSDRRMLDLFDNGADLLTYGDLVGGLRTEWAVALNSQHTIELFVSSGVLTMSQGPWTVGRDAAVVNRDRVGDDLDLRTDLTFDLGFRARTPIGLIGLSVGNILSLLPLN